MDLSERIVKIRNNLGLSQEKFGEMVGKSQRTVAAWEAGTRMPSFSTLCRLADVLDVSTDFLLGREDNNKPTVEDDGLRLQAIARVRSLSDPALARVSDFLDGLEAGQEIASTVAADRDPAALSDE